MILAISHSNNKKYWRKQVLLLEGMSKRAKEDHILVHHNYNFRMWRDFIRDMRVKKNINGVVIMDEYIPFATVYRGKPHVDVGISENTIGNDGFIDTDNDGYYEIEELPEKYTQDVWVSRLVPYSQAYTGVGNFKFYINQIIVINSARCFGSGRNYPYMLDYWRKKFNRTTARPTSTFVATSDWSKIADEETGGVNKLGFHLNMENLRKQKVFENILGKGQYGVRFSDPQHSEGVHLMWFNSNLGTAWHSAHSSHAGLGDFRYDEAFAFLKEACGPSLLLLLACSVGEWQKNPCRCIVANIFNSRANNNIKTIIGSGIIQWGGGFQTSLNSSGSWIGGDNFFSKMLEYKNRPIGLAQKAWLNDVMPFCRSNKDMPLTKRLQLALQYYCMNMTGDPTQLL